MSASLLISLLNDMNIIGTSAVFSHYFTGGFEHLNSYKCFFCYFASLFEAFIVFGYLILD